MESMISMSSAVRRELAPFERMQIWINDPEISPLDKEQKERMKALVGTISIPLHVVVDPSSGAVIGTQPFPVRGAGEYLEFLEKVKTEVGLPFGKDDQAE